MRPDRNTQGSVWSEVPRTAAILCSAALFLATVLSAVEWQEELAFWARSDAVNGALLATAVVIDAVMIVLLTGFGSDRHERSPALVPVRRRRR